MNSTIPGLKNKTQQLVEATGKSWARISREIGISEATLAKVYKNESVTTKTWVKLCTYFDVSLDDLVTFKPVNNETDS